MAEVGVPSVDELVAATDRVVAGLDDVKRRLAVAIHRHLLSGARGRAHRPSNVLVIGPPGGGKTFTVRTMLEASGAPWIEGSATEFSDVGYVGRDLTTLLASFWGPRWHRQKVDSMDETVDRAERFGIVVLDEFDKLRKEPNAAAAAGRQVGPALQAELLKMSEGGEFFAQPHERAPGRVVRTHHMLWIGIGAFEGIHKLVEPSGDDRFAYQRADHVHIMEYGFRPELVRRFATMVVLPPLTVQHLLRVLEEHVWPCWQESARDGGFELVDDGGLQHVAASALHARMGASALESVLEDVLWRPWAQARPGDRIILDAAGLLRHTARLERAA